MFPKDTSNRLGFHYSCKDCYNEYRRENRIQRNTGRRIKKNRPDLEQQKKAGNICERMDRKDLMKMNKQG